MIKNDLFKSGRCLMLVVLGMVVLSPICEGKNPFDYLGYFHVYENADFDDIAPMANVILREYSWSGQNSVSNIKDDLIAGAESGVGVVPDFSQFFRQTHDPSLWEAAISQVREYVGPAEAAIPFISVIDEPIVTDYPAGGFTVEEVEAMVTLVKKYFPNTKTWVNHSGTAAARPSYPHWPAPAIVQNSDYVGFDMYVFRPVNNNEDNITCSPDGFDPLDLTDMTDWFNGVSRYIPCASPAGTYSWLSSSDAGTYTVPQALAVIKTLMAPGQQIIAIGEASADGRPYPTHVQQQAYFDWALADSDVVGLVWYKWPNGVKDNPATWPVHTAWADGKFVALDLPTDFGAVCPEWGVMSADLNADCYVDLRDMAVMSSQWITCTDPSDPINCVSVE